MATKPHRLSLFSQPLDRAAFLAYFLGAVVPLAALAWVVQRWVRPSSVDDTGRWALLGGLVSIALLSLGSFLVLRKTAHAAVVRLDRENRRLGDLLDAAHSLAVAGDEGEIFDLAAAAATTLAGARSGHVLTRKRDGELVLIANHGDDLSPAAAEQIAGAAQAAIESLRPTPRGADGGELLLAVPFGAGQRLAGALVVRHDADHPYDAGEIPALSTLSALATVALRNDDLREAERNFFTHATNLLVSTLDRYLDDRVDHSRRVARLVNRLGRALELPESRLERLHFAALLHDIGMLRIARANLGDREEIERHPVLGDEMLRPIRLWEDLAPFVRHHQEWFDGTGYPDKLRGDAIPLESRIIALAEAFDAMTSPHSYQRPISTEEAFLRLRDGAGSQFDPEIVAALVRLQNEDGLG